MDPFTLEEAHGDLAAAYVLGALAAPERVAFRAHLSHCRPCAAEVRALMPVGEALASLASPAEPSASVRAALIRTVGEGARPR